MTLVVRIGPPADARDRIVIRDPKERARLNPGPSPEAIARCEALERMVVPADRLRSYGPYR